LPAVEKRTERIEADDRHSVDASTTISAFSLADGLRSDVG